MRSAGGAGRADRRRPGRADLLQRSRRGRAGRAAREVPLEVVLPDRQQRGQDDVPDRRHHEQRDDPAVAAKKVMGATTDDKAEINFDRDNQPGISNLLEILSLLQGVTLQDVIDEYKGQTKYGNFKAVVASEVEVFLTDFQNRLSEIDENAVIAKLEQSERDMIPIANETLLRAQQAVGLRPKD